MRRTYLLLASLFAIALAAGCQRFSSNAVAAAGADAQEPDTSMDVGEELDGMPPSSPTPTTAGIE